MKYEAPSITDLGSIADHTFTHTNPRGKPVHKDHNPCETDKFGEYSCHGGVSGS